MTDGRAPRVSVVVPVFNGERFLAEALSSVLEQTFEDFEVVVSDNASTDHTAEIVASFGDPRVRMYRNATNVGAAANWRLAVEEARAPYVKLLCADDLLYPGCIERQTAVLDDAANADVVLVTGVRDVVDESGRRLMSRGIRHAGTIAGHDAVRRICRAGTNLVGEPSAAMFRAEAYRAAGPWSLDAGYATDVDLWARLLLVGDLCVTAGPLSAFRVHAASWSGAVMGDHTRDMRKLLERMAADPRYGVTGADAAFGSLRAWSNARLRQVFYRVFL
jgi:glycosyltransferase involved in cell wall biosynthesis